MKSLTRWLTQAVEQALGALMVVLVVIVLWQVASRYVMGAPSRWTDEGATVLLVWITLLGGALGFARRAHLGMDALVARLPGPQRAGVEALVHLIVVAFAITVLIWGGSNLAWSAFGTGQMMPALQMARGWFYLPLPVSGALIAVVSVEGFLESVGRARMPAAAEDVA